ncbi:MAG TPA: TspO/MBR family protein, partial [Bacillota bacterium]|nr:TspO/MBR family protein [Bacillota bacterium]
LCLNAIWSPLCFGLHNLALSSVDILLLCLVLLLTVRAFFQAQRLAGWLLVPYLLWVSYAATLNVALWRLNP